VTASKLDPTLSEALAPTEKYFRSFFTDYTGTANNFPFVVTLLSSGTVAIMNGTADRPGILRVRDSTTANGGVRISLDASSANLASFRLAGGEKLTHVFKWTDNRTTSFAMFGIHNASTGTIPTNGVYLRLDGTATGFTAGGRCTTASVETATPGAESFVGTFNTWYNLVVELNSNATVATFSILNADRTSVLWTKQIITNIPTGTSNTVVPNLIAVETTVDAPPTNGIVDFDWTKFEINRQLTR
jgi:hypothetical protein